MQSILHINALYQILYQILVTITPIITTPYLARILGPAGTGEYSYTLTISSYFSMFVMLGVRDYGIRLIAKSGSQSEKECIFWEVYTFQFICGVVSIFLYYCMYLTMDSMNNSVVFIQGFNVVASCLDINWFFFGIERFKFIVSRNIIIKLCTITCIFIFVKSVYEYTVIMVSGTLISQLILWALLKQEVCFVKPSLKSVLIHVKPNLMLFIPVIAENVYHLMDKTMLGYISNYSELGYYYNSDKMINISKSVINGLGVVFMARIANLSGNKEYKRIVKLINLSFEFHAFICCALAFGIGAVATEFIPLFFGDGFEQCINLMFIFCPILIIKTFNIFIETEYFLPMQKEKYYSIAVIVGGIINLIFNFILIPKFNSLGASIGTMLAELSVLVVLLISFIQTSGMFNFKKLIRILPYFIVGTIMLIFVRFISNINMRNNFLLLILESILGGTVYILLCLLYWKMYKNNEFGRYAIDLLFKHIIKRRKNE